MEAKEPAILTIGYGGREIGAFLGLLKAFGIELLLDVRSYPVSRFQLDYRKNILKHHLEAAGLSYLYLGKALGGRREEASCYVEGRIDYERVRRLPTFQEGIAVLDRLRAQGRTLALMCAEKMPERCHRTLLIGETLSAMGVPVSHIDETGTALAHAEVMARLQGPQKSLL